MSRSQGDDALVGVGHAHGVQLPAIHRDHHSAGLLCLSSQTLQAPIRITGGNKYFINGPATFQGFRQCVTTLQLPLDLFHRSRSLGSAMLFIHIRHLPIHNNSIVLYQNLQPHSTIIFEEYRKE